MKKLDALIPEAITIAEKDLADKNGRISEKLNGYIASFGAAVILSGLRPSVAFYENKNAESAGQKRKLMQAIFTLVVDYRNLGNRYGSLMELVLKRPEMKKDILDAATALKLAVRTFKQVDDSKLVEKDK